jgi:hypothetical protein
LGAVESVQKRTMCENISRFMRDLAASCNPGSG